MIKHFLLETIPTYVSIFLMIVGTIGALLSDPKKLFKDDETA
jgi:hypothetical protein